MRLPSSTLLASLGAIDRTLAIRRVLIAGSLGALLGTPALVLAPSALGVGIVIAFAATAGWLSRGRGPGATAWLSVHDRSEDLIVSGVAVASGTARHTALAERVVTSAARAVATTRPSLLPALLCALAIAALVFAIGITVEPSPRAAVPADRAAAGALADTPTTAAPSVAEQAEIIATGDEQPTAPAAAPRLADRRDDRGIAGSGAGGIGAGSSSTDDVPGGLGSGASATGAGAAHLGSKEIVAPSTAAALVPIDTSAPVAGAGTELLAVPPRYRAVVRAFMEAK